MSHTHGPGESHSHSHGPEPPQQQQRPPAPAPPDPAIQALIDAQFTPVDLKIEGSLVRCAPHNLFVCKECNVDFLRLSQLASILSQNPNIVVPPPGHIVNKNLSTAVNKLKEEGNTMFKTNQNEQAVVRYTVAASAALQRAPWENNNILREELSTVLSNRSAAFEKCQDWISALADAEAVISIRKNWAKGYLRKAKALRGMIRLEEALDAVDVGMLYEGESKVCHSLLVDCHILRKL